MEMISNKRSHSLFNPCLRTENPTTDLVDFSKEHGLLELSTRVANMTLDISTKQVQMSCCLRSAQIIDHIAMLRNSNNSHNHGNPPTILSSENSNESVAVAPSKIKVDVRLKVEFESMRLSIPTLLSLNLLSLSRTHIYTSDLV